MNGERIAYGFDNAIIATGSVPLVPPFKGDAVHDVLTSELLFKQETLPRSVVIIGGGPIGVELAQMLAKLTVKCTIIEMLETILSGVVEPEFAEDLARKLAASGIDVFTSAKVLEVNRSGGGFHHDIPRWRRRSTDHPLGKSPRGGGKNGQSERSSSGGDGHPI